ncbi:hypothetical protein SEA_ARCHERNM_71 [Mycobacterium phage ArcherNM]|uniref:hypothetical protein n=1 Tax=Mycobacterium phage ArcherNM TaxID=1815972 RepID=UPI00078D1A02|nr:hypothetical protein BJD71_gp71 [Mycobacterium phage ArcherNM]AMS01065.1 hypothetical protein SEA_ARCHERNM_71 [Mycobacterium phage ArcherNM]
MLDQTVFIVIDPDGRRLPYLADDMEDALKQHSEGDGTEVEGIFVYGSDRVGLI